MNKRYVLRDKMEIDPSDSYALMMSEGREEFRYLHIPPEERLYHKIGGGKTDKLEEAEIIGWVSINKRWKKYIEADHIEALEVTISLA